MFPNHNRAMSHDELLNCVADLLSTVRRHRDTLAIAAPGGWLNDLDATIALAVDLRRFARILGTSERALQIRVKHGA